MLSVSSIADQLHSPEHFTYGEETQYLCPNYSCCNQLLPINIPDSAQNTLGGHGASGVGGVVEEASGVSNGVNDRLSIILECSEIWRVHLLSLKD